MKEGSYLRTSFHSGYSIEGYVYERNLWLKQGLVLTDDNQALIRTPPHPSRWGSQQYIHYVNGERFRLGPWPEERLTSEPLSWYPFCVDGKWGMANADTGEVMVEPQ